MTGTPTEKIRLDQLIVNRGLAPSRQKARAMVMAGVVSVGGVPAGKPGTTVPASSDITLREPDHSYVSRGGLKLEKALDHFQLAVEGMDVLDIGASTGGFTDCLLKRGAARVIAVDVGYGQLDWNLRQDPRVEVRERTNARFLTPESISPPPDGAVLDVSFISLRLVVPPVSKLLAEDAFLIALIKPQFEAGRGRVGKGGVVRDPAVHKEIVEALETFFSKAGWNVHGTIPSPVLGPKGNREFLCYMTRRAG